MLCASTKMVDVLVLSLCRDTPRVAGCDCGERQHGMVGEALRCSRSEHNNSMPHQQLHLQNSIDLFCLPCRCSFLCCCSVPCRVLAPQEHTRPSFTDMSLCGTNSKFCLTCRMCRPCSGTAGSRTAALVELRLQQCRTGVCRWGILLSSMTPWIL